MWTMNSYTKALSDPVGLIHVVDPVAKAHWDAVRKTLRPASETLAHLKPRADQIAELQAEVDALKARIREFETKASRD